MVSFKLHFKRGKDPLGSRDLAIKEPQKIIDLIADGVFVCIKYYEMPRVCCGGQQVNLPCMYLILPA